jgi:hypothetical protein
VRFEQRLRDLIHSGAIVLAVGRWNRSRVVPGRRYRTAIDMVEVGSVLLTLSFASGGGPAARRPSPVAGGPGGSTAGVPAGVSEISTSRLRPTTPRAGIRLTASGEQPPAVS